MKRYILAALLAFQALTASAFQIWTPSGTTDTKVEVNPKTGKPTLKQDLIDNVNSGQANRTLGYTFGRSNDIDNVRCDLWEGPTCTYVFPAAAQQMAVVSSSADDAAAGTGARSVEIHYLDANYAPHQITVTLNGTTPVLTVPTNILRINRFHVYSAGSGGTAAGNISVTNVAGTVTYAALTAGRNVARQAIYTVPAGVSGYISHWQASSGAVSGNHFTVISIHATMNEGTLLPGIFNIVDEVGTLNNSIAVTLPIPVRIPATTDVKMSAISDASSANVVAIGAIMGWFETIEE